MWWEDLESLSASSRNSSFNNTSSNNNVTGTATSSESTTAKAASVNSDVVKVEEASAASTAGKVVVVNLQQSRTPQPGHRLDDSDKKTSASDSLSMVSSVEFRKMNTARQTEELFILVQRLLPLVSKVDNLTETVSNVSSRMSAVEDRLNKNPLFLPGDPMLQGMDGILDDPQGSDSMLDSTTTLGESANKPDPFIIKRSREINK